VIEMAVKVFSLHLQSYLTAHNQASLLMATLLTATSFSATLS